MRSESVKIDGIPVKIYSGSVREHTVLAVHGFGGSKDSSSIESLARRLTERGFCVAAPDLPCHGERTDNWSELTPQRCVSDILAVEDWLSDNADGDMSVFATSFGGCCILRRLELRENRFRRILLRVPAVNMADSLLRCVRLFQPDFTLEQARREGFRVKMAKEMHVPYSFYEQLSEQNEIRHSGCWDSPDIMVIYAGGDELIPRCDTEEFLRLNPSVRSLCFEESGHRMSECIDEAIDKAAEFLLT